MPAGHRRHLRESPGNDKDFDGDIGYNFLVCRHGNIYEGRGYERGEANVAGYLDDDPDLGRNAGPDDRTLARVAARLDAHSQRRSRFQTAGAVADPAAPARRALARNLSRPG
ncbi:hypothetical protein AB0A95_21635 [Micromonospora sp. NPDC049230]|uniref:hypothetical protein n=1 Tax=Micromonospora sp. NPDC049230 TaxID=3155502 RepID=UPI0033E8D8F6